MRLRESEGRVRLGSPQRRRQQCLSVVGDRRLPVDSRLARLSAAGGRLGPRAAYRRRGGQLGRRADRLRRERRPRAGRGLRALGDVRRTRGGRRQGRARDGAGDQDARSVQAHRHRPEAHRHAAQSNGRGALRHRYPPAEHGLRRRRQLPGIRRQAQVATIFPRSPAAAESSPPCR